MRVENARDNPGPAATLSAAMDADLIRQHNPGLRLLALELVGDPHRAEDLVQDTWTVALQDPSRRWDDARHSSAWLRGVLRNLSRSFWRGEARARRREQARAQAEAREGPADTLARAQAREQLLWALTQLEGRQREVLVMRYFDGQSPREIARRLQLSGAAVRSRLHRGLANLREILRRQHPSDPGAWMLAVLPLSTPDLHASTQALSRVVYGKAGVTQLGTLLMTSQTKALTLIAVTALLGVAVWFWRDAPQQTGPQPPDGVGAPVQAPDQARPQTQEAAVERSKLAARPEAEPEPQPARGLLRGRVLDLRGAAVAGARIHAETRSYHGTRLTSRERLELEIADSDAEGRFALPALRGHSYLTAETEGLVTLLDFELGSEGVESLLILAPRRSYSGQLRSSEGAPLPGKELSLVPDPAFVRSIRPGVQPSSQTRWSCRTDARGTFSFTDVPFSPGSRFSLQLAGYQDLSEPVPAASTQGLQLVMLSLQPDADTLAGRVLLDDGQPAGQATVYLGDQAVDTDEQGGFLIPKPAATDTAELIAAQKGWLPVRVKLAEAGFPLLLTLREKPKTISGVVVDGRGMPVEGAEVFTRTGHAVPRSGAFAPRDLEDRIDPGPGQLLRSRQQRTDAAGRFTLGALVEGDYLVFATHAETQEAASAGRVPAGTEDLRIMLQEATPKLPVAGRVLDLRGNPLAGLRVFVGRRLQLGEDRYLAPLRTRGAPVTDPEGRFRFPGMVVRGTYLILSGQGVIGPDRIQLEGRTDLDRMELRVPVSCRFQVFLQDAGSADSLQILDAEGRPLRLVVRLANTTRSGPRTALVRGRSEVVQVPETATTLVLLKGREEVRRMPIELQQKGCTVLRF